MGIQSRKTTSKKNNVTINVNIEETPRPVKVIKQPKPVVKVVKQPKPVVVKQRAPDKTLDKTQDRVTELKNNASTFQSLRDKALNQGITLPQNFSAIPDIRNSNDLTMVNKTLLDRIKILEDKLNNQKPTTPVLTPNSTTENQPLDFVSLSKELVRDTRVLVSSEQPNQVKIKAILKSIATIKGYINLDDNPENDQEMEKYIESLDTLVNKVNGEITPIDDDHPDEPEIIQYQNQLPDYVISALKSRDRNILNKALSEAVQAQLISPITKATIQQIRNIYQQTTPSPGSGPSKNNLNNFIGTYIDPTRRAILEPLTGSSRQKITALGRSWTPRALLATLTYDILLDPNLKLIPGTYRPVIQELDDRLNVLAGYTQNIKSYAQANYPAINQNIDNLENKITGLEENIASGERDIKRSYMDEDEDNQKSINESLFIMDNTQGDVAASVAYMLDGDGIELTPDSIIMLVLDEAFQAERPDLLPAYNLQITDGDDGQLRTVLEGETDGVPRKRLFNSDGTLYFLPEPEPDPEPDPDDDFSEDTLLEERAMIFEYIKGLYYTKRGSDGLVDILYEELLEAYGNPNVLYTMELTDGDVALAKALLSTNTVTPANAEVKFVQKNTDMPEASAMFNLVVNGQVATEPDGNTPLKFNATGDIYGPPDIQGIKPNLTYPHANDSRDDL